MVQLLKEEFLVRNATDARLKRILLVLWFVLYLMVLLLPIWVKKVYPPQ